MTGLLIGVALKWVDLRPEVDPLTGQIVDDGRSDGCSALRWATVSTAAGTSLAVGHTTTTATGDVTGGSIREQAESLADRSTMSDRGSMSDRDSTVERDSMASRDSLTERNR